MTYTAKVAVCSEIRTKHSKQSEHHVEFFSVKPGGTGFGSLEVARWPLVPKFAGSNPAEAVGFLRAKKSSARLPSEGK